MNMLNRISVNALLKSVIAMLGVAIVVMLAAPKGIWGLIVERVGWQVFPLERRVVEDGGSPTAVKPQPT